MKRYFLNDKQFMFVSGHTFYVSTENGNVEVDGFIIDENEDDNFITLCNGEWLACPKSIPLDWLQDVFIFKHLDDAFEMTPTLRQSVATDYKCSPTVSADKLKKIIKDRRYLKELGIEYLINYYDDASVLVTEVDYGIKIHHTRHNRRFPTKATAKYPDDNIRPVFIYKNDVYICPSDRNANGILRLDDDKTLYLAKYGELEEEIFKFI